MRICKLSLVFIIIALVFFSCKKKRETIPSSAFVSIEDNHFIVGDETFFPLMLNYVVSFQSDGDRFIVAPAVYYDSCNYADAVGAKAVEKQLKGHFGLIRDLGFNTVRVCFDRIGQDADGRHYYAANRNFYLDKKRDRRAILHGLSELVKIAEQQDLKVMLLIKPPFIESTDLQNFTIDLLEYFKDCPTLFAYDFMNEPLYFDPAPKRQKKDALAIVNQWKKMMAEHAPNQLFTIGFAEPLEVFEWDCSLLPVDFVEVHTYHPLRVPNEIYWYSRYCGKPWMIGETGLPADNDSITYEEQAQFVREAYQLTRDAGGCGFGLWEFQDNPGQSYEASYTGLVAHDGESNTTLKEKYAIKGTLKPAAQVIATLEQNYIPRSNEFPSSEFGDFPVNYQNMLGYKNLWIFGTIVDAQTEEGIEGAVIRGWNDDWSVGVNTFSDKVGSFFLYCNDVCNHFEISAPGYTKIKFDRELTFVGITAKSDDMIRLLPEQEIKEIESNFGYIKGKMLSNCNLPEQKLEYQSISYHPFVKKNIPDSCFFQILNFDPLLFDHADWESPLGILKLEKMSSKP